MQLCPQRGVSETCRVQGEKLPALLGGQVVVPGPGRPVDRGVEPGPLGTGVPEGIREGVGVGVQEEAAVVEEFVQTPGADRVLGGVP